MDTFKIHVNDRNYASWSIFDTIHFQTATFPIHPLEQKLFSNDVFRLNSSGNVIIIHSSIRSGSAMPGVLVLEGNKTYGRQKTADGKPKKNAKLLYKCIPDDMRLPPFLVTYEIKNKGLSKKLP
jgi:hypothetical protein